MTMPAIALIIDDAGNTIGHMPIGDDRKRVIYTRVPMDDNGTVRVMRWVQCFSHPYTGYVCTATRDVVVGGGSNAG